MDTSFIYNEMMNVCLRVFMRMLLYFSMVLLMIARFELDIATSIKDFVMRKLK